MRAFRGTTVLTITLVALSAPLAAQSNRPINLFSLEDNGAGAPPLHVFRVDSTTGALSEVPGSPVAAGSMQRNIAVDSTGRFVYVTNQGSNDVTGYAVDATTGSLTPLPGSPYATGGNPGAIATDPTGRFLYLSTSTVGPSGPQTSIYAYTIDSGTGVLTAVAGSPFAQTNIIDSITFDPKGNYVFFGQNGPNSSALLIDSYDFATGAPVAVGRFQGSGALFVNTMDPGGKFLYATDPGQTSSLVVSAFTFDSDRGSLSEIQGSPFPAAPGPLPFAIVTDPAGKFLYVVSKNYPFQTTNPPSEYDGSISAFTIEAGIGALTTTGGSPFAAGINPISMVVDPTGHLAYASSTTYTTGTLGNATILGYTIDASTGALKPFSGLTWMDTQNSNGNRLAISYGPIGIPNPAPMLSSLSPPSVTAGGVGFALQVTGINFVQGATVYFGGRARNTTFVSATQLNADILGTDIANGGTGVVFVFNPLPGGGPSASMEFTVFNPAPTISSINPSSTVAGGAGLTLAVNGSNFVTGSLVNFNGTARPTTYVGPTQLTIAISAGDVANQGAVSLTVTNLAKGVAGGGTSNPVTLTILPASVQPIVDTLIPASKTAGDPAFMLTVTGSGFTASSVVTFNRENESTTYISSTQLQAAIPASAIALAGTPVVIVTNPGAGVSLLATFVVNDPAPVGDGVSPPSVSAGGAALALNVTGMNFTQESAVLVDGSFRVTTYVSSTSLQATLLPSDLSHGRTLNITVRNPPPGGGTTAAIIFTVADYFVSGPTTPTPVTAGQPANFSLTVAPSIGTFSSPVAFTATGLPLGTTATFSPSATITPGKVPTNVMLSIATTAHSFAPPAHAPHRPGQRRPSWYLIVAVGEVVGLALRISTGRVRRLASQLLLALVLASVVGIAACGGTVGGTSPARQIDPTTGTPAGTYPILVTATSGTVVHTTQLTLTVM